MRHLIRQDDATAASEAGRAKQSVGKSGEGRVELKKVAGVEGEGREREREGGGAGGDGEGREGGQWSVLQIMRDDKEFAQLSVEDRLEIAMEFLFTVRAEG